MYNSLKIYGHSTREKSISNIPKTASSNTIKFCYDHQVINTRHVSESIKFAKKIKFPLVNVLRSMKGELQVEDLLFEGQWQES